MSQLKELEDRLRNVIHSTCNSIGCKNCDLKYDDGCSATDLQNEIADLEEANTHNLSGGNSEEA